MNDGVTPPPEVSRQDQQPWRAHGVTFAILFALLLIFGGFLSGTRANVDYICTRIIEDTGSCTNGAWSHWQTVATETEPGTGATTVLEERIYTGTRTVRHVIEYLSRRTSCNDGFEQEWFGDSSGKSGFWDGNIVTESQVCQIAEQRRTHTDAEGISDTVISQDAVLGDTVSNSTIVSSLDEIDAFRRARRDLGLSVRPALVTAGSTTEVRWITVEMVACQVSADTNADTWGAVGLAEENIASTAGLEISSPIASQTTYTLECIDFAGELHQETATVRIAPEWQEF